MYQKSRQSAYLFVIVNLPFVLLKFFLIHTFSQLLTAFYFPAGDYPDFLVMLSTLKLLDLL